GIAAGALLAEAVRAPPGVQPGRGLGAAHRRSAARLTGITAERFAGTIPGSSIRSSTMAESLTRQLFTQLQGAPMQQISQQLGLGEQQTSEAVGAALPLLLGALGRNASQPQGAQALLGALQKDHAGGGDITALLGTVLGGGGGRQADGAGILG